MAITADQSLGWTQSGPTLPIRHVVYLPTVQAYDQWAKVYDIDGNVLQGIDDMELASLLPSFLGLLPSHPKIVDFGCGTGRNTLKIVGETRRIVALDACAAMLARGRERVDEYLRTLSLNDGREEYVSWHIYDALPEGKPVPAEAMGADGLLSTLVLEHLQIDTFFTTIRAMLKPGGYALVTNMHPEMGALSQAGFVDPVTGNKVRPVESYVHTIEDVVEGANEKGLKLVWNVRERGVGDAEVVKSLGQRGEKWKGVLLWFGLVFEKEHEPTEPGARRTAKMPTACQYLVPVQELCKASEGIDTGKSP